MKKILLVDDDYRMLKLLSSYLEPIYSVVPMKSGNTAIDYLKTNDVDLILLDYVMPEMDGPTTLEKIRQMDIAKNIPVIFLTGVTERGRMAECMMHNPEAYMVKPVTREELLNTIAEVLN